MKAEEVWMEANEAVTRRNSKGVATNPKENNANLIGLRNWGMLTENRFNCPHLGVVSSNLNRSTFFTMQTLIIYCNTSVIIHL